MICSSIKSSSRKEIPNLPESSLPWGRWRVAKKFANSKRMLTLQGQTATSSRVIGEGDMLHRHGGVNYDGTKCKYSQFQQSDRMFTTTYLSDHVHDHMTSRQHQQQYGWRFTLRPPWASRHMGGSRSMPTVHRCPQGKAWVAQKHHTRQQDSNTLLNAYMVAERVR